MNYSLANKKISISGKAVITDWRQVKVIAPGNIQEKIKANENVKKEVEKQKEIDPTTSINTPTVAV